MEKQNDTRHRRLDLLEKLPRGAQTNISRILKTTPNMVSTVLNGKTNQNTDLARNIIRMAEHRIEIEKYRSRKRKY